MAGLPHNLREQRARADGAIGFDLDAGGFGLLQGAVKAAVLRGLDVWKAQGPFAVVFDRFHEGVENAHRDVEVGDSVLAGFAGDEGFNIRVIHAQYTHIRAAPGAALRDLSESAVVDAQKAYWPGRFAHAGKNQAGFGAQSGEGEAVAAAGLLNERRIPQRVENAARFFAHVVFDGQHKARG